MSSGKKDSRPEHKLANFFKDKNGNIVIAQRANPPLLAWFFFQSLVFITRHVIESLHAPIVILAFASIIYWALLEIFEGVCTWRKALGLSVYSVAILIMANIIFA
jgi:hypothetical protein